MAVPGRLRDQLLGGVGSVPKNNDDARPMEFFYAIKREGLGFPAPRSYRGKRIPPCRCGKAKGLLHAPPKVLIG
jgi:hypothetical protein